MQVYECSETERLHPGAAKYQVFGRIEKREVDDYNGPIKVFVPMGSYDCMVMGFWGKVRGEKVEYVFTLNDPTDDTWEYLSDLKLQKFDKEAVVQLKKAIRSRIKEHTEQAEAFEGYLRSLK